MVAPSYGATRRLGQAKAHEFSINQGFKHGYRNREDLTTLPPGVLIPGSQNVLTNTNGRVAIRGGYTLDGQANSDLAPIASSFDWFSTGGQERNMRSGFLTNAGNDGKLQYRTVAADGTVTWTDLLMGLTSVDFNYVSYWNPGRFSTEVLMVNGTTNLYTWNGAAAEVLSAANPTGIIASISTPNQNVSPVDDSGGVDYAVGDILTISGGAATIKVTQVRPGAIKTSAVDAPGTGYAPGDRISIDGDGDAPYATIQVGTVSGGGGVLTYTVLANGINYATGSVTTTHIDGGGTGFTLNILTTGNGIAATPGTGNPGWEFVSDADHGTGYSTGVADLTGGSGTNAKVRILGITSGSITKTGTQTWAEAGFFIGTGSNLSLTINGTTYDYNHFDEVLGDTTTLYGVTPDPSGISAGTAVIQSVIIISFKNDLGFSDAFTPNLIGTLDQRVFLGTAAKSGGALARGQILISRINDYTSYVENTTYGDVGDPFEVDLTSAPTAFVVQEQQMYVAAGTDEWYLIQFTLSADLLKESVSINRLNTTALQAAQSQAAVNKIANSIVFLSFEPNIRSFGRVPNVLANNAPQMSDLSFTIINDMNQYDFTNAALFYYRKFVYVAVPAEGLVLIYNMTDEHNPYWEAPQILPISRFSIIGGQLYGHSSLVSETYKLFTGTADRVTPTSTGNPIQAIWRFSYEQYGSRFDLKRATKAYVEGYISSGAVLNHYLTYELDGCKTVKTFTLDGDNTQFVCIEEPSGPLGKESLGKVKLGGDQFDSLNNLPPKFHWFPTFSNTDFYEVSPSFSCLEPNAQVELIAFGLATAPSTQIPVQNQD